MNGIANAIPSFDTSSLDDDAAVPRGAASRRAALLLSLALAALYCILAANRLWPLIDGDGTAYFPPVIEWSVYRPLTNPVWLPPLNDSIDGPDGRRFIYHGFLYALVVGHISRQLGGGPGPSVAAAYLIHWLVACSGTFAVLIWAQARGGARARLRMGLPPALLALSLAWHGRVEPLALLLVTVACWSWRVLRDPWREMCAGATASLVLATSPTSGVLAGCLVGAALAISRDDLRLWRRLSCVIAGYSIGAAVAVALYPYPIRDWVGGLIRHGRIHLALPVGQGIVATWLARPELPLLIVSFGLIVIAAVSRLCDPDQRPRNAALVLLLAFAIGVTRLAFWKTEASYNAVVWMPLLVCFAVSGHKRWREWAVIGALLLPAMGFVRSSVMLARQFQPDSISFRDAQARIRELAPSGCAVTSGLWMAAFGSEAVVTNSTDQPDRFFVQQQTFMGLRAPRERPGYRLIENRFGEGFTVLGLPLSRTPGGWNFAVYEAAAGDR